MQINGLREDAHRRRLRRYCDSVRYLSPFCRRGDATCMPLHGPKLAVDVGDVQNHPDEITIPRLRLSVMLRHIVVTLTLVLHASGAHAQVDPTKVTREVDPVAQRLPDPAMQFVRRASDQGARTSPRAQKRWLSLKRWPTSLVASKAKFLGYYGGPQPAHGVVDRQRRDKLAAADRA
jgi:hypothetical protein